MVKAVIFDLDNTLIDFVKMKKLACEAAVNAMIDNGLNASKSKAMNTLFDLFNRHGWEHQKIFQYLFKELTGRIDYKAMSAGIVAYRRVKDGLLYSYPGVAPTLRELKAKGLKLAILADAPRIQAWLRLAAMGLHQEFDVVVTFDDVKRKKPAPEPFLLALKKLKVKPREAVMVGDSPQRDIATAQRLGMTTVLAGYGSARFLSSKKTAMQAKSRAKPDFVIKDVRSLLRVVSE